MGESVTMTTRETYQRPTYSIGPVTVPKWQALGAGGLGAFVALGQLTDPGSGPIGTAVAVGAVVSLGVAIVASFRSMREDVQERQALEDALEEATDEDVAEAIEQRRER